MDSGGEYSPIAAVPFKYVFIPSSIHASPREITGNTAGGLENDEVRLSAAAQFGFTSSLSDHRLVDICTLHIPTKSNGYIGISVYSSGDSSGDVNTRATKIAQACGHEDRVVYGDAFLSRCYDNEEEPWVRRDLTLDEIEETAPWILAAASVNRGRNLKSYTTGGMTSNLLNQMSQQQQGSTSSAGVATVSSHSHLQSGDSTSSNSWGFWTQTPGEIEVFKIKFGYHQIVFFCILLCVVLVAITR